MKRYFEFVGADSSRVSGQAEKFWEISLSTAEITVRFGKIGANGQTTVKSYPDAKTAKAEAEKLVAEKLKKGYVETGIGTKVGSAKTSPKVESNARTTECIACAEKILSAAKLCKHCGTRQDDLTFGPGPTVDVNESRSPQKTVRVSTDGREATDTELDMMSALILIWNPDEFGLDEEELFDSWNLGKNDVRKIQKWQGSSRGEKIMTSVLEQVKSGFIDEFNEFLDANPRLDKGNCRAEISELVNNQDFDQSTRFVADIVSSLFEKDPKAGLLLYLSYNDFEDWLTPKTWAALHAFLKVWWGGGASQLIARVVEQFDDPISQLPY